jgi:hypothetical protein
MQWLGIYRRCRACVGWINLHKRERPESVYNPGSKDGCKNPVCLEPESAKIDFYYSGEKRRCDNCYTWTARHGGERPAEVVNKHRVHDGCKNPACLEPESDDVEFMLSGEKRRCYPCYHYKANKKNKGRERPASVVKKYRDGLKLSKARRSKRIRKRSSKEPRVHDGCKNPACLEPESDDIKFLGSGEKRRCMPCYKYKAEKKNKGRERPASAVKKYRDRLRLSQKP